MRTENPRQEFAIRAAHFREAFGNESDASKTFDAFVEEIAGELDAKQINLDAMFKHFDAVGFGATYGNFSKQFAFVLPDATHPGLVRCQYFDSRGFFSHSTRESADLVVLELCEDGYTEVAPTETLDTMSKTLEWQRGMAKLAVIQAVQNGQLTWEEGNKRSAEIDLKYDPDLWAA